MLLAFLLPSMAILQVAYVRDMYDNNKVSPNDRQIASFTVVLEYYAEKQTNDTYYGVRSSYPCNVGFTSDTIIKVNGSRYKYTIRWNGPAVMSGPPDNCGFYSSFFSFSYTIYKVYRGIGETKEKLDGYYCQLDACYQGSRSNEYLISPQPDAFYVVAGWTYIYEYYICSVPNR